jgi:hypothetical protein
MHAFLCVNDVRKELISQHVLKILNTQHELSLPDVLLEIHATIGLSIQEWLWVTYTTTQLIVERETEQFLASKGLHIRFAPAKELS